MVNVVKKHRGPSMLFDVHACKWEDCVAILFNEKNQSIGPTDDDVSEFSKFWELWFMVIHGRH